MCKIAVGAILIIKGLWYYLFILIYFCQYPKLCIFLTLLSFLIVCLKKHHVLLQFVLSDSTNHYLLFFQYNS